MQYTGNLGLKKPEGTDVVNIDDLNQNFDILDVEVVKVASPTQNGRMSAADKTKLDGIETGAQRNTVTSVNNKTGAVTLTASDVGASPTGHTHAFTEITGKPTTLSGYGITDAETPSGAQAKANQAETNAKAYTDQKVTAHSADNVKHITAAERAAWNSAEANAKAYADTTFARKQQEAWIAPTLLNGWNPTGSGTSWPGYMKDEFSFVHIKANIYGGTTTDGTIIFNLPQGYRPSELLRVPIVNHTYDQKTVYPAFIQIKPDGNVEIHGVKTSNYVVLDGISFRV